MFTVAVKPTPCLELVAAYEKEKTIRNARKITFLGVEGYDVYNISVAFKVEGKTYIAGRVEKRENEMSMVRFFEGIAPDTYQAVLPEMTFHDLQDPFVTFIHDEMVMGGVQIIFDPLNRRRIVSWHTCFFRGKTLSDLKLFAIGPSHMKDIRLGELPDGRIAIFTRPQGKKGGFGKIGFMTVDSLDHVNGEDMLDAQIAQTHFIPEEWGGANDVHLLKSGLLGVMGHISRRDDKGLHYQAMCFAMNPQTGAHTPLRVVACRKDMSAGPSKRPDLADVLFTGGIVRHGDGTATLYTGVSDCEAYCAEIDDPFKMYA